MTAITFKDSEVMCTVNTNAVRDAFKGGVLGIDIATTILGANAYVNQRLLPVMKTIRASMAFPQMYGSLFSMRIQSQAVWNQGNKVYHCTKALFCSFDAFGFAVESCDLLRKLHLIHIADPLFEGWDCAAHVMQVAQSVYLLVFGEPEESGNRHLDWQGVLVQTCSIAIELSEIFAWTQPQVRAAILVCRAVEYAPTFYRLVS